MTIVFKRKSFSLAFAANNISLHGFRVMGRSVRKYWVVIVVLLLGACANIVAPTGGPKDTKPPVVVKTTPLNGSKQFAGKSVRIDFNKFVKLNDAATEVVVSPFMKQSPEFKIKGRSIVVNFNDTLKPNTTYSIAFGKAIADINEGNVLLNFRYVFSTGNFIDSLTLKGIVRNALMHHVPFVARRRCSARAISSIPNLSRKRAASSTQMPIS